MYFITGNKNKLTEIKDLVPNIEQLDIDLDEIQELDPQKIIEHKLLEAKKQREGVFMVEDTCLMCDKLNGLPGPLIKWFLKALGPQGIADIAKGPAKAVCTIGLYDGEMHFFQGIVEGEIVDQVGDSFGWDPIFVPKGHTKRYSEMTAEQKNAISHRRKASEKLLAYLKTVDL